MRQRFHHVIIDCRQRDAQLLVDLAVGLFLEAVHPEDARRFLGQLLQRLLEAPGRLFHLNSVFLLGAARRIVEDFSDLAAAVDALWEARV